MEKRHHRFLEKIPILAALVIALVGWLILVILMGLINAPFQKYLPGYPSTGPIGLLVGFFLILWFYRRRFRPEFEGNLIGGRPLMGIRLGIVILAYLLITTLVTALFTSTEFGVPGVDDICLALVAGFGEEMCFRGLLLGSLMRQWREEKRLIPALIFSAVVFGVIHGTNVFAGASVENTLTQIVSAACIGFFLGAVYLRSGSLWPPVIMHTVVDIVAFCNISDISDGVMVGSVTWNDWVDLVLCIVVGAIGIWLIRPEKRKEVLEVWDRKWRRAA